MKINEVEQAVGITRKNIRFYEEQGLLKPGRAANGYREYTEEDLQVLLKVKLLRKLAIPLEEIRRLQSGHLTLEDCLRRHLITLERESKNLEAMKKFCGRILSEDLTLGSLPADRLLTEMENMEEGGTKFMDAQRQDKKIRKRASLIVGGAAIVVMAFPLGIILWFTLQYQMPLPAALIMGAFPAGGILCTLAVLRERMHEIEGGELYEASKY